VLFHAEGGYWQKAELGKGAKEKTRQGEITLETGLYDKRGIRGNAEYLTHRYYLC